VLGVIVSLAFGVVGGLTFIGGASAAVPVYPATFSGPSAHHRYNVELDTGCYQGSNSTDCDVSSNYFSVQVVTPKAFGKCPGNNEFTFDTAILKKDGTFSATQAYGGGRKMTVSGRFTSPRSAHGTVSGNEGCALSEFTITLPKPLVPVPPPGSTVCYWLDKAHATQLLGGASKPRGEAGSSYSVITGLGQCTEWTRKAAETYYGARTYSISISQTEPEAAQGTVKKVSGLGPTGAFAPNLYDNTAYFRKGSVWVVVNFEVPSPSKLPAATLAAQGRQLLTVARRIYALTR
jgi:hypothetical protein